MALSRLKKAFNDCAPHVLRRRQILAPLRAQASGAPAMRAAFDWLEREDIRVVFDDRLPARKVMARYNRNAGKRWIALSPKFKQADMHERADTLVHEIRHAWQDRHDLMLPYSLKFNMQYGMQQAFIWLCAEEADAHAHGMMAAAEAFGAKVPSPLGYQAAYIDWFTAHLGTYLDTFIAEWDGLLADIETRTQGDAVKMRAYLDDCREAEQKPVGQAVLRALGRTLTGDNYQHDNDFSRWVQDVLIPRALAGPVAAKGVALAQLDARMAAFDALAAANQNATPRRAASAQRKHA